ncbi:glycosyltransferase family 90 [Lecanosticta acicola]|uniref:Glycosyltransferase family 90 n=1 Tax=Lecanosticta acicola TaxID=111012 RepID=A0AAI8Z574_9PEZI|nr:glycosyltransferase family 90 [Lecanosticta acicola]
MHRARWPAVSGLVLGTVLLSRSAQTTFAFDKAVHTGIVTLLCAGVATLGLSKWLGEGDGAQSHKGQRYEAVPLNDVGEPHASRQPSPVRNEVEYPSSLRKQQIYIVLLSLLLSLRVELMREVLRNVQCSSLNWEPWVPVAIAAWDYWTVQRKKRCPDFDDEGASVYETLEQSVVRAPFSLLAMVSLSCAGGMLALASTSSPKSTFICAAGLPYRWMVPLLQHLGTVVDVLVIFCIAKLLTQQDSRGPRSPSSKIASVGYALLLSAATLLIIGIVYFIVQDSDRDWILTIPHTFFWSVLKLECYVCFTALCAFLLILDVGVMTTTLLTAFTALTTITTTAAWQNAHPFPPAPFGLAYLGVCLAILGFMSYFHLETISDGRNSRPGRVLFQRVPSLFYLGMLVLFFLWSGMWVSYKRDVSFHPIDMLIYEAEEQHQAYVNATARSIDLSGAVSEYQNRYSRLPPPGFDHWYMFARQRNSTVIDGFDSIDYDLLPFWALAPAEIRQRTWELISNPWNDAAGISVRNGKVSVMPNVVPTHMWMLEGLVEMIGEFSRWLPDMDLAFNINDEPRVALPYKEISTLRSIGSESTIQLSVEPEDRNFSTDRAGQWRPVPEEPNPETPLQELSWAPTFHRYGSIGCHPDSPARSQRRWDVGSLCLSCIYSHSLGAFISDWSKASDVCQQPDLADIHGFYMSPAAFKGSRELYPIFSQSKAKGFNDILYPSAWNYIDKATYSPSDENPDKAFKEKENKLFWRGATSEGVSSGRGQWRGMTRQRFNHLATDINGTTAAQPIMIPTGSGNKLEYINLPISTLQKLLPTDVHIVDAIARCAAEDCPIQHHEFSPLAPPIDFQSHWQYKYLLDLDGAGFSGRFLPFLHSRSVVFKSALFREWWDDRLTPWVHFVPLDLRGHGFWATLAYFTGINSTIDGIGKVEIPAKTRQGERIAEQGREWAGKVLRKEDMEIYFFRLLLEWGRLTDDKRDSLGFEGA